MNTWRAKQREGARVDISLTRPSAQNFHTSAAPVGSTLLGNGLQLAASSSLQNFYTPSAPGSTLPRGVLQNLYTPSAPGVTPPRGGLPAVEKTFGANAGSSSAHTLQKLAISTSAGPWQTSRKTKSHWRSKMKKGRPNAEGGVQFRGTRSLEDIHLIDQSLPPDIRLSQRFGGLKVLGSTLSSKKRRGFDSTEDLLSRTLAELEHSKSAPALQSVADVNLSPPNGVVAPEKECGPRCPQRASSHAWAPEPSLGCRAVVGAATMGAQGPALPAVKIHTAAHGYLSSTRPDSRDSGAATRRVAFTRRGVPPAGVSPLGGGSSAAASVTGATRRPLDTSGVRGVALSPPVHSWG